MWKTVPKNHTGKSRNGQCLIELATFKKGLPFLHFLPKQVLAYAKSMSRQGGSGWIPFFNPSLTIIFLTLKYPQHEGIPLLQK